MSLEVLTYRHAYFRRYFFQVLITLLQAGKEEYTFRPN